MKSQCIFLLFVFMGWQCSSVARGSKYDPLVSNTFCGSLLSRTLATICSYEHQFKKRSDELAVFNPMASLNYDEHDLEYNWPWVSPHRARLLGMSGRSRDKRQIVAECCDKPCTLAELSSYC